MKSKIIFFELFFLIFFLISCSKKVEENKVYVLKAKWEFRQVGKGKWLEAKVPGNVHLDLEKNDVIKSPFYGENESKLQWIEHEDWEYKGVFEVENEVFKYKKVGVEFEGLDTYSDVYLNENKIITSENMFVSYFADIKKFLKKGKNTLRVVFHSPIKMAMPMFNKSKYTYPADNDRSREHLSVFTRKSPYHYGWDWGPRFVTSGIWKPIKISMWNDVKMTDIHVIQNELKNDMAKLMFEYEIVSSKFTNIEIELSSKEFSTIKKTYALNKGRNTVVLNLTIKNPKLWWPNGIGDPYLYEIKSTLKEGNNIICTRENKVGLRTIKVINERDSIGESFYLKINNKPIFIKGANYIPNDSFLGRVTDSVYKNIYKNAVVSNLNMLRVWGGGIYENDIFYDLADENGILIWQDFMFACTMYPSDSVFLENVEKEAIYNIKRLRNHTCLALWCGNNEIKVGWDNWGWQKSYNYTVEEQKELKEGYNKLFNKLLPDKVRDLDSSRFYFSSSPISNWGNKSDFNFGDNHYWGVWWGKKSFDSFNEAVPRFMSEYGFQAFPSMKTISKFSDKKSWSIDSSIMQSHQKSSIGNATIKEYMARNYIMPTRFTDFVYLSQVMQAEGMKIAFVAHRRNKPFNMGTIYWQFNDVWPAVSWSGIDYYGNWKAMQYFVKKSFEPILASAVIKNDTLQVNIVSDLIYSQEVVSNLKIVSLSGKIIWSENKKIKLKENDNLMLLKKSVNEILNGNNPNEVILVMNTNYNSKKLESIFSFTKTKNLKLNIPKIIIEDEIINEGYKITLTSDTFVKNLQLSIDANGWWSDNYFDMLANEKYTVYFHSSRKNINIKKSLKLLSVRNTY